MRKQSPWWLVISGLMVILVAVAGCTPKSATPAPASAPAPKPAPAPAPAPAPMPVVTPAPATTSVPDVGPPRIPHDLEGRDNCLMCHKDGIGGAPKVPTNHVGRTSETCRSCHQPAP